MSASLPELAFISVVPSPYQRDVFNALAQRNRVRLRVYYLENAAPDSPWPEVELASWEKVLPGFTAGRGRWRSHFNWPVPKARTEVIWVVNGAMTDFTTQLFIRRTGNRARWYFWGECPSQPLAAWKRWLQARQYSPLRAARGVVAVGERARAAYSRIASKVPIFNQPYACQLSEFVKSAENRVQNAEPVFLFCGQMIARKGVDLLLRAFAQLVTDGTPGRLELIGREAELPQFLREVGEATRRRITYRGFYPPAALPEAFAKADVFILPSRHDGWGVVVNQALAAGAAVICSDAVGAAHDLIRSEVNGLLVPAGDAAALVSAMRRLALSPALRAALSVEATKSVANLTPECAAAFWEKLALNEPVGA